VRNEAPSERLRDLLGQQGPQTRPGTATRTASALPSGDVPPWVACIGHRYGLARLYGSVGATPTGLRQPTVRQEIVPESGTSPRTIGAWERER
jgi:hypothetical protein